MVRKTSIYLRGAYGPGNLGDDVLMIIMVNFLKTHFSEHKIMVSIEKTELGKKIDSGIAWIPLNCPVNAKVTILGGGGQFFSFNKKSLERKRKNNFLMAITDKRMQGYRLSDLVSGIFLRKFFKVGYISKETAAFCIGVGPFENEDGKLVHQAKKILSKSSFISVRDKKSRVEVKSLVDKVATVYTDICFNREYWFDSNILELKRNSTHKKTIGVILRKWEYSEKGKTLVDNLISFSRANKYNFKIIFFDERKDFELFELFQSDSIISWNPSDLNVNEFLKKIKTEVDLVISCRAHGVLLSAICHIPSLAVEIEPKLKAVHQMLPNTTRLITEKNIKNLEHIIGEFLKEMHQRPDEIFEEELEKNEIVGNRGLEDLKKWLCTKL